MSLHRSSTVFLRRASTAVGQYSIATPVLVDLEHCWETLPPPEQAEIWMSLRDRMTRDWKDLTPAEKKATYYVSFGPHGPRAIPPKDEWKKVTLYTLLGVGISGVLFFGRQLGARPPPKTMTPEWQEKTNEYLRSQNVEPLTGVSSERGRKGRGMVQSDRGIVGEDIRVRRLGHEKE